MGCIERPADDSFRLGAVLCRDQRAFAVVQPVDAVECIFGLWVEPSDFPRVQVKDGNAACVVGNEDAVAIGIECRRLRRQEFFSIVYAFDYACRKARTIDAPIGSVRDDGIAVGQQDHIRERGMFFGFEALEQLAGGEVETEYGGASPVGFWSRSEIFECRLGRPESSVLLVDAKGEDGPTAWRKSEVRDGSGGGYFDDLLLQNAGKEKAGGMRVVRDVLGEKVGSSEGE